MPQVAELFKALADPNRLRIVNILSHCELCVGDLQTVLGLSQPFVSRHLAYLRRVGLVNARREGPRVCYSLALDDALRRTLRSLLRVLVQGSQPFQSDIRELLGLSSSGRLRSGIREIDTASSAARAA